MALKQADRVRETSTTTGTGAMSLGGSPSGYQTFGSVMSDGDTCTYAIVLDSQWETGVGTYSSSGNTLTRTTVLASSNSNAAVSFGAGSKSVFISPLASDPAFSEELRVPAGSVSSAAVQANDDPNSGIYFPAADTVAVTVGGTQALKVETTAITAASPLVVPAGSTSSAAVQASGDPNTGITFPAADTIALVEGGVEALRINSSGEVIVGNGDAVASPSSRTLRGTDATGSNVAAGSLTLRPGLATGNAASGALIVQTGTAGASGSALQTATERLRINAVGDLIVGNGDAVASPAAATFRGTDGSGNNIAGGNVSLQGGRATGNAAGGYVRFLTSSAGSTGSTLQTATEAARFDSSQRLLLGVTSANTAGGVLQLKSGITFPATQVASSDANTLDDYEEGTWTPTLPNKGTGTFAINSTSFSGGCRYTKIGRLWIINIGIQITTSTFGTATGNLVIDGLPVNSFSGPSAEAGRFHAGTMSKNGSFTSYVDVRIVQGVDIGTYLNIAAKTAGANQYTLVQMSALGTNNGNQTHISGCVFIQE